MINLKNGLFGLAAVTGAALCAPAAFAQGLALEPTTAIPGFFSPGDVSAGWAFTTNGPIIVNALDVFDITGDGAVRLYDASSDLLASAVVTSGDPVVGAPYSFHSHAIIPITLQAGQTYFIAQDFTAFATFGLAEATGLATNPGITYDFSVAANGDGQDPMSDPLGATFDPGYFGPNFQIGPTVPEPGTLALLLCLGAPAATLIARRRAARLA